MIFVTVGTHEQPFNRLLEKIDSLIESGDIKEEVIAQIGYSTYTPKHYKYEKLIGYNQMQEYYRDARIIITHGGPSSFVDAVMIKKVPIVVPRQATFDEHVNDHQLEFSTELESRGFPIKVISNIDDLGDTIKNHKDDSTGYQSNNEKFVKDFEEIVESLFS